MKQAWTYSQGMQDQGMGTTPEGENIITLEDMEEKRSTVRKKLHNTMYKNNRLRRS